MRSRAHGWTGHDSQGSRDHPALGLRTSLADLGLKASPEPASPELSNQSQRFAEPARWERAQEVSLFANSDLVLQGQRPRKEWKGLCQEVPSSADAREWDKAECKSPCSCCQSTGCAQSTQDLCWTLQGGTQRRQDPDPALQIYNILEMSPIHCQPNAQSPRGRRAWATPFYSKRKKYVTCQQSQR